MVRFSANQRDDFKKSVSPRESSSLNGNLDFQECIEIGFFSVSPSKCRICYRAKRKPRARANNNHFT